MRDLEKELSDMRERLEAAEAATFRVVTERNAVEVQLTEARAALTAVKDAAWNAAIEAAGNLESIHGYSNAVPRHRIRALRRNPKEGKSHE